MSFEKSCCKRLVIIWQSSGTVRPLEQLQLGSVDLSARFLVVTANLNPVRAT